MCIRDSYFVVSRLLFQRSHDLHQLKKALLLLRASIILYRHYRSMSVSYTHLMESDMLKGYELGAEDYVTKPFPMSVFQKKLAVVLGRLTKQYGGDTYAVSYTHLMCIRDRVCSAR